MYIQLMKLNKFHYKYIVDVIQLFLLSIINNLLLDFYVSSHSNIKKYELKGISSIIFYIILFTC